MGVSTGQWRAAIGRSAGAQEVTLCCSGESESSRPPGFFGLILAALLLVSGVETNPGPVDKSRCELCGALFTTLSEDVEKRERAVSEKERSLLELERQLQEGVKRLNDKKELLETKTNQFQEREMDVNEREVVLKKKEGLLAKREGQISERERLVSGREALLSGHDNKVSGRESVVSQRENLLTECKALALKKGSLVSECSSVVSERQGSTLEQGMGEATVHTEECGGDAVPPSPTVLLAAAAAGRLEDVQACLEGGRVPVDCRDEHGRTPLLLAATNGHPSVVRYLVSEGGAEVFARDKDGGRTALHCAAQNGHLHVVQFLVKETEANIKMKNAFHETALHLAARAGNLEAVRLMVQAGKVDFRDMDKHLGHGILAEAAGKGHLSVVRFLV